MLFMFLVLAIEPRFLNGRFVELGKICLGLDILKIP